MHVRVLTLSLATILALTFLPANAGARTSFPVQRVGSGKEPLAGGGSFGGVAFAPRSAAIQWDTNARSLTLYLFELPRVQCTSLHRTVAIRRGRSNSVIVASASVRWPALTTIRAVLPAPIGPGDVRTASTIAGCQRGRSSIRTRRSKTTSAGLATSISRSTWITERSGSMLR